MSLLPEPVVVRNGALEGIATHNRFGFTLQSWAETKLLMYRVLGKDTEDGIGFQVMPGVREDTGEPADKYIQVSDEEYALLLQNPTIQSALVLLVEFFNWKEDGEVGPNPLTE